MQMKLGSKFLNSLRIKPQLLKRVQMPLCFSCAALSWSWGIVFLQYVDLDEADARLKNAEIFGLALYGVGGSADGWGAPGLPHLPPVAQKIHPPLLAVCCFFILRRWVAKYILSSLTSWLRLRTNKPTSSHPHMLVVPLFATTQIDVLMGELIGVARGIWGIALQYHAPAAIGRSSPDSTNFQISASINVTSTQFGSRTAKTLYLRNSCMLQDMNNKRSLLSIL